MASVKPSTATSKRRFVVDLRLTPTQIQAFYAGAVSQVSARDRHGLRIAFPLASLRQFIDHSGITGSFVIDVDQHNRLQKVERL